MIHAVLDTNTLVSAVINIPFSVSQEIYQNFIDKHFVLVVSPSLLAELEDVLKRERVTKFHKRSDEKLQEILSQLSELSYFVPGNTKVEIVRDPADNKIISAALEGKADYIMSRDRDLLDLKEYQGIQIVTTEEFMGILRSEK